MTKKPQKVETNSDFKSKANWSISVMERIHYVGIALIVAGILFLKYRGWHMLWLIAMGSAIIFLSWGWALLYWDCPHCGKNLRGVRSILTKIKYCPFCGAKL